jgi:hypothetical protein
VLQTREDEVAARLEVAVDNRTRQVVTVETLELRVPGLGGGGVLPKGEPLPAGQRVDLPTPYGEVSCAADGRPRIGKPRVVLQVHTESDPASRRMVLVPRDPDGLLARIATDVCLTRKLTSEVSLAFGRTWRASGSGSDAVLRGTLEARLLIDAPRDVTQVAGTVIYRLVPRRPGQPLAHLTAARPRASIPIEVSQSRCDGHARGETKQPYAFLVWLAPPGGAEKAITPQVTDDDRAALRSVCPL